ncbi:fused DSP-PTPase phosphatase/NAD kinase-like protein [Adhaeretor mobilis]|uniref:Tyrosine phosphatase family protein n=1 Tax=Adhaeretor mobilis TaxID=1930276 RepID=A0A517MQX0_9BACT|nr:protein tyrosine phosphatase family protein [Adhaeretor mobilis]QDS97272.1 Tyrosine phosphatase family protein [Adhaeretor mobilis]
MFRLLTLMCLTLSVASQTGCGAKAVEEAPQSKARQPDANQQEQSKRNEIEKLEPTDLGAARPAHVVGQVYMAGQPSEKDIAKLKEKGIRTIVTLRTEGEISWDEKAAVEAAGMTFVSIPFRGEDELTDEVFDKARAVLKDKDQQPVLLHCGGADRVGALWMAHRAVDDGLGIDAALKEAKTAGLRSEKYQKKAEAYIERNK